MACLHLSCRPQHCFHPFLLSLASSTMLVLKCGRDVREVQINTRYKLRI
ncbi:unnamed protein product [Strongylus vulgaris]|uniref:Uncharacterized protein n=1 Tax=Strongylus vulgaris TaxID=40348 RepID=A0A3P7KG34_STRVU|nr:unnamed protein product [Strongylus vulgaris]